MEPSENIQNRNSETFKLLLFRKNSAEKNNFTFFLNFFSVLLMIVAFVACNDKWDEYYGNMDMEEVPEKTVLEYLEAHPEYSQFTAMLKTNGLEGELKKDHQITIWTVCNDSMNVSNVKPNDTLRIKYHLNYLPFIRTDLKNGLRIRSLNGIYFQITQQNNKLYANASQILKSVKLKNGVIHEISRLMKSRMNIYDYLKGLDKDYSLIRDSIFKYNVQKFDKVNSIPIGVNKEGNTVYDSVFYVYNPIFETVQFNSEFKQFTVFLPSNAVIHNCMQTLTDTYRKMGKVVEKSDSALALKWIREAMFYNGEILTIGTTDIKSAYNRIWRPGIQQVDISNPQYMSNGVVYNITKVKIPNNVIISRIKSLVHYWEYQEFLFPAEGDLYVFKGLAKNPEILVGDATPKPAILPNYILLQLTGKPESTEEFSVEFSPFERFVNPEDGKYKVRVMEVPTGEYNFYMGFRSSGHPFVNIYFNNRLIASNVQASLSTPWNYDRVTETERDRNPLTGTNRWDGLGGLAGVVTIPGEGMASFRVKVEFSKPESAAGKKVMQIYHWSLKPTANNY